MNQFETIVQSDPTLKFLIRDAKFDADKLEHQIDIRCAAINIALGKYIDSL